MTYCLRCSPTQDASDHQDYQIFSKLTKSSCQPRKLQQPTDRFTKYQDAAANNVLRSNGISDGGWFGQIDALTAIKLTAKGCHAKEDMANILKAVGIDAYTP